MVEEQDGYIVENMLTKTEIAALPAEKREQVLKANEYVKRQNEIHKRLKKKMAKKTKDQVLAGRYMTDLPTLFSEETGKEISYIDNKED